MNLKLLTCNPLAPHQWFGVEGHQIGVVCYGVMVTDPLHLLLGFDRFRDLGDRQGQAQSASASAAVAEEESTRHWKSGRFDSMDVS